MPRIARASSTPTPTRSARPTRRSRSSTTSSTALPGVAAERAYLPWLDMSAAMREAGVPLFSLESCSPVRDFDLVGITIPYELTYTNILETLDLAGIPLRAAERGRGRPARSRRRTVRLQPRAGRAVLRRDPDRRGRGGGRRDRRGAPGGQGRGSLARRDAARAWRGARRLRAVALRGRARRRGRVRRARSRSRLGRAARGREARRRRPRRASAPPVAAIVPFMDVVHDRFGLEVLRGCTRGCRFCQAGMVYRPVRERTRRHDRARRDRRARVHRLRRGRRSRRSRRPTTASSKRCCGACSGGSRARGVSVSLPIAARRRVRRRDGAARLGRREEERADVRAGGRHAAHARRRQQERDRGGPARQRASARSRPGGDA